MDKLIVVLPVTVLFLILLWYLGVYRSVRPEGAPLPPMPEESEPRLATASPRYPITRRDCALMALLCAVYGFFAFFILGNIEGPQSVRAFEAGDTAVFDFGEVTEVGSVMYFTSLHTGEYVLEYSEDGESWQSCYMPYYRFYVELPQEAGENGMKCFGAYYVPAIAAEYIADMPLYDGHFN